MSYYFTKNLETIFDEAVARVTEQLKGNGFGILTVIDLKAMLKKKLDIDFYNYKILGACNPKLAYQALQSEDKIGAMLPCNVIVQQKDENGVVEISAVDPMASMQAVENENLGPVAIEAQALLKEVIDSL
ncbi:MAG: hypothetical protein DRQ88_04840 [Epsilonproteobacteria bacterium]|nr:MAG: hypothetical protein DRQ88_04840 [Campylobacterota bacterium]